MKKKSVTLYSYFVVLLGALFYFYEYFLRIAPSVMEPTMMHDFHINAATFGTLSAFYFYAYTPMQLVVGVLVDRYKIHHILTFAVLTCAVGSFMIASTNHIITAEIGRFMQGFGSAFGFVGALKLAATELHEDRFATFAGLCATLGFFGAGFGQILLNQVVQDYGWRNAIHGFALIGLALAIAFWVFLHRISKTRSKHALTFTKVLIQFKFILGSKGVWLAGIISCLMFLPTSVFAALWGIPYLKAMYQFSNDKATFAIAMIFFGWGIGSPLAGWISDTIRNRINVIRIGSLFASILVMVLLFVPNIPYVLLCALFVLFGIFSSSQALTFVIARDLSPNSSVGSAIAFINTLAMLGGMIFQSGLGRILQSHWDGKMAHDIPVYTLSDYQSAIIIIPLSVGLAFVISLLMKDSYHHLNKRI